MSYNSNALLANVRVIQRLHSEWESEDPVIGRGYAAYSTDTKIMRVGNGSSKWSTLEDQDYTTYVGPHASTHMPDGHDPIVVDVKVEGDPMSFGQFRVDDNGFLNFDYYGDFNKQVYSINEDTGMVEVTIDSLS